MNEMKYGDARGLRPGFVWTTCARITKHIGRFHAQMTKKSHTKNKPNFPGRVAYAPDAPCVAAPVIRGLLRLFTFSNFFSCSLVFSYGAD